MKAKLAIVVLFLVAAGAIVYFTSLRKPGEGGGKAAGAGAAGAPTEVTFLYSTEKKDWVEAAAVGYQRDHPEVKLTLIGKGSLDGAQAILEGKIKPTLFSPADSLILNMLSSDWQTQNRTDLFAKSGEDVPQPLVITPLVFVIWEDRAEVLLKAGAGKVTW